MAEEKGGAKGANPEEEIEKYLKILGKDPQSRAFAPLAEAYRKAGMLDDAIDVARDGLNSHPNYLGGMVALGRALFEKGQYAEARDEIAKVVAAAPGNLMAHKLLGRAHLQLKNTTDAEQAFRTALLLDPRDEEAQKYLNEISAPAAPPPPPSAAPVFHEQTFAGAPAPPVAEAPPAEKPAPAPAPGEAEAPEESASAAVSSEPIFDLDELETKVWEEDQDAPASELKEEGEDSPFEIYTKEPAPAAPVAEEGPAEEAAAETDGIEEDIPFFDISEELVAQEPGRPDAEPVAKTAQERAPFEELSAAGPAPEEAAAGPAEQPPTYDLSLEMAEGADLFSAEEAAPEEAGAMAAEEPPIYDLSSEMEEAGAPPVVNLSAEMREPALGSTGAEDDPDIFTTETLADLYIRQGFYGKAADVYRRLLRSRSHDNGLKQKLEEVLALERMQGGAKAPEPPKPPADDADRTIAQLQELLIRLKEIAH